MNDFHVEIDYELAAQVLSPFIIAKMRHFGVVLFDIAAWQRDYEPSIASLFSCCAGGSFSNTDPVYGDFFVRYGNNWRNSLLTWLWLIFPHIDILDPQ